MTGRHLDLTPRVREARLLHERYEIHAAIDVSDGLAIDLSRVATASGCGAVVELSSVPIHPDVLALAKQPAYAKTPIEHALGDGEDFELILAVPPEDGRRIVAEQPLETPVTRIGEFIEEVGLWSVDFSGNRKTLEPAGFEHK